MTSTVLANGVRLLTLVLGSIAGGAMLRFYWLRRGATSMPHVAAVAFFLMLFYMLDGVATAWNSPWNWLKTPVALAAAISVIVGVYPYLQFKRHPPEEKAR